ncbi:MAG: addiction module toxin RelE, partial [Thermodesulfobacteriota bacterium]|nr:addiction module toxin RelE [Thermodesulfobacteriota bacterium]
PRTQRFPGRPALDKLFAKHERGAKAARNRLIKIAHLRYGYTLKEIADELGLHYTTISKALNVKN